MLEDMISERPPIIQNPYGGGVQCTRQAALAYLQNFKQNEVAAKNTP